MSKVTAKGLLPFGEHQTWYRVTGDLPGPGPAVVVVHGGPGSTHDYLVNLTALADGTRAVVHYDQIGNGGSTHLPDRGPDFWTVRLFRDELDNLVHRLGLHETGFVLLGQSWGGMLSAHYAAGRPEGLRGLVVANAPASYPLWNREAARLRAELPPGVNETLLSHEAAGTTDDPGYHAAMRPYYLRHVCRLDPWPRDFLASFMEIYNDPTVYFTMNGPSEFHVVGTLRDWSVEDRLPLIEVPTLVISGRHDEATPETVRPYADLVPGARWEILEESSHMPHLEEPGPFLGLVAEFLAVVDGTGARGGRQGSA